MLTPYPELNDVLHEHAESTRRVLRDQFVGFYLQGSFSLGAGDEESDADFIVVTAEVPSGEIETRLRKLHDDLPGRRGHWNHNLEGSYADMASLRSVAGIGVAWLYANRGHRELIWSDHDNTPHTRWILRHHGKTLDGPPITDLVDDVPQQIMIDEARQALPGTLDGIREWADMNNAWTQKYIVQTYCRVLYTLRTGEVTSKRDALNWAAVNLDPRWRPLLAQVAEDRSLPWSPVDPPRPRSMELACEFAANVEAAAL